MLVRGRNAVTAGSTSSLQGRADTAVISRRAVPCFHALFSAWRIQHEEERIESNLLPVRCSDKILNAHDNEMLSMYTCREMLTEHRKHRRFPPSCLLNASACVQSKSRSQSIMDSTKNLHYPSTLFNCFTKYTICCIVIKLQRQVTFHAKSFLFWHS